MAGTSIPKRNQSILERRFIELTLKDAAKNWRNTNNRLHNKYGFDSTLSQSFQVTNTTLTYEHVLKNRFIDMKRVNGKPKKRYPIHNNVVMGYFNAIITDLQIGFTEEAKQMLSGNINLEL